MTSEGQWVAGEVARLHEPGKQRVHNDERLTATRWRQRAGERPPKRVTTRQLSAGRHHPALRWLRIGQEALVQQQILVCQGRERLAELDPSPQQQALGFAPAVGQGVGVVGEAGEPSQQRVAVGVGGDLPMAAGAIRSSAARQRVDHDQVIDGRGSNQPDGHGFALLDAVGERIWSLLHRDPRSLVIF